MHREELNDLANQIIINKMGKEESAREKVINTYYCSCQFERVRVCVVRERGGRERKKTLNVHT